MGTVFEAGRRKGYRLLYAAAGVAMTVLLAAGGVTAYISATVPALFRLNRQCQEEGYWMAEFEFKMLGCSYLLDKGRYVEAIRGLHRLHEQLRTRQGLVKVPKFAGKREETEFYLRLQNPRTGALMDETFPYCTWDGPTQNVLLHLEALASETRQPLRLRYPLRYLEAINSPLKLTAYLDDVSNVGWIAARFPQTSFHFARELLGYCERGGLLDRTGLYTFSPEWKQALLAWFYGFQDAETGLWGPKSRNDGRLLKRDLNNTSSIIKAFVDEEGNDRYREFPLRHKPELFASALAVMTAPPPAEADLDEWHEWVLATGKSVGMLTRYLWNDTCEQRRTAAAQAFERYLRARCERQFIQSEGAFSYYPGARHATLDGTSSLLCVYLELGAFSAKRQGRLWGGASLTCRDLGRQRLPALTAKDLAPIVDQQNVNSVRFYVGVPDEAAYSTAPAGIFYPRPTPVLDALELATRVRQWLTTTDQSMGNWVSREELSTMLARIDVKPTSVTYGAIPLAELNRVIHEHNVVTVIGFDTLQIPRWRMTFRSRVR
jgi:hypothetical protein